MKKLHELCAATMLLILLSVSALAGEISTGVISPPPPPPASATVTAPGEIGTGATTVPAESQIESETLLSQLTLSLLRLLSVI